MRNTANRDVREQLLREHAALARGFDDLRNASERGEPGTVLESFRALDARLRAHMTDEEETLLPALARRHPEEVRAIEAEHAQIRATLELLAVQAELHALRDETIAALIERLETHARREDEGLYRYAEAELVIGARESLLDRVLHRLGALSGRLYA